VSVLVGWDLEWSENWICMKDAMFCYCGSAVATMGLNTQGALDPFRFVLIAVSGWMNHRQLQAIEYLRSGAGSIPCR